MLAANPVIINNFLFDVKINVILKHQYACGINYKLNKQFILSCDERNGWPLKFPQIIAAVTYFTV